MVFKEARGDWIGFIRTVGGGENKKTCLNFFSANRQVRSRAWQFFSEQDVTLRRQDIRHHRALPSVVHARHSLDHNLISLHVCVTAYVIRLMHRERKQKGENQKKKSDTTVVHGYVVRPGARGGGGVKTKSKKLGKRKRNAKLIGRKERCGG